MFKHRACIRDEYLECAVKHTVNRHHGYLWQFYNAS